LLAGDPIPQVAEGEAIEGTAAFAIGSGEGMVIDQRMKPIATAVPEDSLFSS